MHIQRHSVANSYSISGPDVLTMPIPNISHGMLPLLECPLECSLKHIRMCVCTCVCTSLSVHVSPYIIIRNDGSRNIPHPTCTSSSLAAIVRTLLHGCTLLSSRRQSSWSPMIGTQFALQFRVVLLRCETGHQRVGVQSAWRNHNRRVKCPHIRKIPFAHGIWGTALKSPLQHPRKVARRAFHASSCANNRVHGYMFCVLAACIQNKQPRQQVRSSFSLMSTDLPTARFDNLGQHVLCGSRLCFAED